MERTRGTMDLFSREAEKPGHARERPLADRMRPVPSGNSPGRSTFWEREPFSGRQSTRTACSPLIFWVPRVRGKRPWRGSWPRRRRPISSLFPRPLGSEGNPGGGGGGGKQAPRLPAEDGSLRRRDPPVQQGPAGRLSPPRGKRPHHPHRGHHGKPLLRGHRPPALPGPRPGPEAVHGARPRRDPEECLRGQGKGPGRDLPEGGGKGPRPHRRHLRRGRQDRPQQPGSRRLPGKTR